ncbi:MAG: ATP-dependent RNA helicase HrpA [Halieaceae bacterium]|jgi:ATP-dependent helicase HrpA|nr:ATP-dependent RNA helicase HrpA [Halieaceae bacterium]
MSQESAAAQRQVPPLAYPGELPISERREEIAALIAQHPVVVVAGETGSGKTTQLPKICLDLGRGREQRIGHTQPRRLAARTVAQRIAEETGGKTGELVGYQVRFEDSVSDATAVKVMTDGVLLSELARDRELRQYDTLIIDEAHERSLNIDFLLGYLKRLLPKRPDLKLIITSATIDVERFSRFFDGAPVIEVSGRSYPIDIRYLPAPVDDREDLPRRVADTVLAAAAGEFGSNGDMLVFLASERDIRDVARLLRGTPDLDVLPLYARLSAAEQARVFGRGPRRGLRVVLATNVAETSVTVPRIRFVIDPGEARISRYSYRSRVLRLPIEAVSQASANQRAGRCGRVGPGVCLRLYSEDDFAARPEFTDPEIRRSNLAAVVLTMLKLGLGEVEKFPFLEPPDPRLVRDGYRLLEELGAVNARHRLTALGRRMAAFPVDPALSRMILAAERHGVLAEILVIASALAIQDPRERPADKRAQADQAHARFRDPRSDFLGLLNLWRYYEEQRQDLSENRLRKLCKREFLSWLRMREWRDMHRQLTLACRGQGLRPTQGFADEVDYAGVHRALLAGLLGNIAQQEERREYRAARNRSLQLFPGSSVYRKPPKWLVAGEVVETERVFARSAAMIEAQWVLDINPSLLKHHYYEPRWNPEQGRAVAWRRSTLFGLTVADRVSVHLGKVDARAARELLIREGLVAGRWRRPPRFLKHNLRLVREVEDLESRLRRRDLLADDELLFRFYDERLPERCINVAALESWLKDQDDRDAGLRLAREDLLLRDPGALADQFPDRLEWEGQDYRLSYEFAPGEEGDGVTLSVPVALLNRLPVHRLEWLVPGLLRDKCIALVKGLPKGLRRQLVPVPDWVDRALARLEPSDRPLTSALGDALEAAGAPRLAASVWADVEIDDFYRMNLRVVDERGRMLAQSREAQALVERFREKTRDKVAAGGTESPAREGLGSWDFDRLPAEHRFRQAGVAITAFPALVDRGDAVDIQLCDYPGDAFVAHRRGVARLLQLSNRPLFRELRKRLLRGNEVTLLLAALDLSRDAVLDAAVPALALEASGIAFGDCRDRAVFEAAEQQLKRRAGSEANEFERWLLQSLEAMAAAFRSMSRLGSDYAPAIEDMRIQREGLLTGDAFLRRSWEELRHYPRFARAMQVRGERVVANFRRDQEQQATLNALEEPRAALLAQNPNAAELSPSLRSYGLMLDELRVSYFAQHLGTSRPVSPKRLREQWMRVESWLRDGGGRSPEV